MQLAGHVHLREDGGPGRIARGRLSGRMQRLEERDQRGGLRRAEVLSVGRHVAAALDYLADQLVLCERDGDSIEGRPALSSLAVERMAVVALLELKNERAMSLQGGPALQVLLWDWLAAPGIHHRTPGRVRGEMREASERHSDEQDGEDGDGPALPAFLAFSREEGEREQHGEADGRPDQENWCLCGGRKVRQQGIEPEEEGVGMRRRQDDGGVGLSTGTERTEKGRAGDDRKEHES